MSGEDVEGRFSRLMPKDLNNLKEANNASTLMLYEVMLFRRELYRGIKPSMNDVYDFLNTLKHVRFWNAAKIGLPTLSNRADDSLRKLFDTDEYHYTQEIAETIIGEVRRAGGHLTEPDNVAPIKKVVNLLLSMVFDDHDDDKVRHKAEETLRKIYKMFGWETGQDLHPSRGHDEAAKRQDAAAQGQNEATQGQDEAAQGQCAEYIDPTLLESSS